MSETRPPSDATLRATLAAPPSRYSSRVNRTTGTGASGEMRSTLPEEEMIEHHVADHGDAPAGET